MIIVKSSEEIRKIRDASRVAAQVLEAVGRGVKPGVTTKELERIAAKKIKALRAKSASLGYKGYPGVICISVNSEIVHGIPSDRKLNAGDIVSIDVCVRYKGYCGDTAKTFPVGSISPQSTRLLNTAAKALHDGIDVCRGGVRVGDISSAIQTAAETQGFSVSRDFTGHGIGKELHEDPQIPNYGQKGTGPRIPENCCLAVEVMMNEGDWKIIMEEDNWTAVTADGKLSAHFEHTVLVKKTGAEILTIS